MSNRFRIAVITPEFPTQAEPHRGAPIWNSITALAKLAELDVYCTYPRYVGPRPAWLPEGSIGGGTPPFATQLLEYRAFPVVSRVLNGAAVLRSMRRQLRPRPDVILAYWVYPDGYAAVRFGREIDVPTILFSRGSDLKLNAAYPLTKPAYRYALKNAAAVIGVSRDLTECAMRLGAAPADSHTIPNGVDTGVFQLQEQEKARRVVGISATKRVALYVGRLEPKKGLPQLIEAIAIARRKDPNVVLVIVGNGMMEAELRQRAADFGIGEAIMFAGPLKHPALVPWINAADVLCLPSESEGCPNVVVEALACGRPVVATAVGGIPEIVDASCGVLIESNAPDLVADAILRGMAATWNRHRIATRWKRNWEQVARETLQVCQNVCGAGERENALAVT